MPFSHWHLNQFFSLTRKKYADQAIWFLNGFWKDEAEKESENIWKCAQKFIELDSKKKEGNELDEFWSHKFLESLGETLTVIQLRDKLRKIDLDANGKMALLEYLCFKYEKNIPDMINAPQGDNTKELEKAQAELRAVQDALNDVQNQLEEQKRAKEEVHNKLNDQKKKVFEQNLKLDEQKKRLREQKAAEEQLRKAKEEQAAAVSDLNNQELAFQNQITELTQRSETGDSIVAKNKAKQELAQLKQENPLPLRRAKITQEAALRKVEKQTKEAEAATMQALQVAKELENVAKELERVAADLEVAKHHVEEATRKVEIAVRETEAKMEEAQNFLAEVKRKGGVAYGAIWWMEREIIEAKKYLPRNKQ